MKYGKVRIHVSWFDGAPKDDREQEIDLDALRENAEKVAKATTQIQASVYIMQTLSEIGDDIMDLILKSMKDAHE